MPDSDPLPTVAITIGDPAGIGPEIVLKALQDRAARQALRPIVIGDWRVIEQAAALLPNPPALRRIEKVTARSPDGYCVEVFDTNNCDPNALTPRAVSAQAGAAFVADIETSARLALSGKVDAVASGPTNKASMQAAGFNYPGQTQAYAAFCLRNPNEVSTILLGGPLRVLLLSSHVSLRQAIELVTRQNVLNALLTLNRALQEFWAIERPRILIPGLNPHCSDHGLFGSEEAEAIEPAIADARQRGLNVSDPVSADTAFHSCEKGEYDGIIGLYHDQGTIPLKRFGYMTVAAGLPIIRTTAGHGTAYDIAWQGKADASIMRRAIFTAADLAKRKRNASPHA